MIQMAKTQHTTMTCKTHIESHGVMTCKTQFLVYSTSYTKKNISIKDWKVVNKERHVHSFQSRVIGHNNLSFVQQWTQHWKYIVSWSYYNYYIWINNLRVKQRPSKTTFFHKYIYRIESLQQRTCLRRTSQVTDV